MTASGPNPVSCGTCTDSPLSKAASIIGILTFVYAIFIGTLFGVARFVHIERETPEKARELAESLVSSFRETESAARLLEIALDEGVPSSQESRELKVQAESILRELHTQLSELEWNVSRFSERPYHSGPLQQVCLRTSFVLKKEELTKKVRKKNQLMEDLRHLQERAKVFREEKRVELMGQDQLVDRRELQNMLLEILERLARLEEAQLARPNRSEGLIAEQPRLPTPTQDQNREMAETDDPSLQII